MSWKNKDESSVLIDPADFQSIEMKISVMNLTTNTQVRDGARVFGIDREIVEKNSNTQDDLTIKFIEIELPDIFVLELPYRSCAQGHMLSVHVDITGAKIDFSFDCRAKVTETQQASSHRDTVKLHLQEYDPRVWGALKSLFSERQDEIWEFLKAAKGY